MKLTIQSESKKCPITLKMYCLKYENVMMDRMICIDRVIILSYFGALLIEIITRMTEQQTISRKMQNLICAKWLGEDKKKLLNKTYCARTQKDTCTPTHTQAHPQRGKQT